ncbi:hypothetical protein BC829DRAFT_281434 [Chytridium lagenaria]|nr:hypothetical protein BC829DRAFT_281434 [Chytridium lagenaria]
MPSGDCVQLSRIMSKGRISKAEMLDDFLDMTDTSESLSSHLTSPPRLPRTSTKDSIRRSAPPGLGQLIEDDSSAPEDDEDLDQKLMARRKKIMELRGKRLESKSGASKWGVEDEEEKKEKKATSWLKAKPEPKFDERVYTAPAFTGVRKYFEFFSEYFGCRKPE